MAQLGGGAGQLGEAAPLEGELDGLLLAEVLVIQRLGPLEPGRKCERQGQESNGAKLGSADIAGPIQFQTGSVRNMNAKQARHAQMCEHVVLWISMMSWSKDQL